MVIADGELVPSETASLPLNSRGLMYGDGCFETLRAYSGRFLHLDLHLQRLHGALDYLGMACPDGLCPGRIEALIRRLLDANECRDRDAVLRIQAWREGPRGYRLSDAESRTRYTISVSDLPPAAPSIRLCSVSVRRIPAEALSPQYKLSNGINYIQAMAEAREKGADDALMLTVDGRVSETTIANLFWVAEGRLHTPSVSCDLLPGITRSVLLRVAEAREVPVEKGEYPLQKLLEAEAAWTCNSIREIQPVRQVDGHSLDTEHPLLKKILRWFEAYREEHLS